MPGNFDKVSKILTLVFTDLADSTALKTARGDAAIETLISRHAAIINRLSAECGGRVSGWAGDGCFLTFDTSSSAVLFALRLQQAHADEADLPGVRIGIHMGEVTETRNDAGAPVVSGLAVDLASRISGLARPGQVLMSAAVYDSARQRIGVESLGKPILWQAHGAYALKGFDKELEIGEAGVKDIAPLTAPISGDKAKLVRRAKQTLGQPNPARAVKTSTGRLVSVALGVTIVFALVGIAYFAGRPRKAASPPVPTDADANAPISKIAVLPFKNISGDTQQEYFVDGMTEALISELSKIKSIKVISRTSAMHYKDTKQTLPEIARELGVDGFVEGSAMKAGNEVRITAQLIRASTDEHLWAESYTEKLENVLKMQAGVALAITAEIKAVVTPEERTRVNAAKTVNTAAYDLYVQARHFWGIRTPESQQRARDLFTQSLEIDPNFALGHAGLADTCYTLANLYLVPVAETLRLGREETEKAIALDPELGEAYATVAMIAMDQNWDWKGAGQACLKAIEFSPNSATTHHWYAAYLAGQGRHSLAVEEERVAYQLDPASPAIASVYSQFLARDGQIDEALDISKRLAGQYSDNLRVLAGLVFTYGAAKRYEDALAAANGMNAVEGDKVSVAMYKAIALANLGRREDARQLTENAIAAADATMIPMVYVARAYGALNDRDRALEWLTKAADTRDPWIWRVKLFPEFDALEGDPRYQALLRRMNFPDAQTKN